MTLYATLACLLTGLFCTLMGIRQCFHALASTQWPSIPGTIIRSKLISHRSDGHLAYNLDLRYQFNINGQDYKGHRISFRPIGNLASRKSMERYTKRYGKGDRVQVFYNPANPKIAILEPGFDWSMTIFFALGPLFLWASSMLNSNLK